MVVTCDWTGRHAPESLLGEHERAQAGTFTGERRQEWVRTRLTAKAAVRWVTGARGAEVVADAHGAPQVRGLTATVSMSLSHTGALAVCAVVRDGASHTVGVDVEPLDTRNAVLLPRLLGVGESEDTFACRDDGIRATVLVSCKEAALKAFRRPTPSLRDYRLWRCDRGLVWARPAGSGRAALRVWRSCRAGLVTAVCCSGDRAPVRRSVTPDHVLTGLLERVPPPRAARADSYAQEE
ncbi:4'-phosphopantetheinyl transferase superfamily protein [Streptomyces sp. PSAA01]|uniref:4'-phosphopantetheinyl transferase family protein n=1 Tax=Streptomyces sp. PSAA01 TaxID=2912762 RepID=UPI001F47781F|nr:hypothetical protein [Streptomyces sp. PSAA01]MCG0283809.1 hypothetical protein [Streptomyces sp. PSAA01]